MEKFNSESLQSAYEQSKQIIENITDTFDSVSADIKSLEDWLKKQNITESFRYHISDPGHAIIKNDHGKNVTEEEILVWDKKIKRLFYIKYEYSARIDVDDGGSDDDNPISYQPRSRKLVMEKPLIETPLMIRKQAFDYLDKFVISLAKKYDINKQVKDINVENPI